MLSNSYLHRIPCVLLLDPHSRPAPVIKIELKLRTAKVYNRSLSTQSSTKKTNKTQKKKVHVVYTKEILN